MRPYKHLALQGVSNVLLVKVFVALSIALLVLFKFTTIEEGILRQVGHDKFVQPVSMYCKQSFQSSIYALLDQVDNFFIFQVGANDGISHDDVVFPLSFVEKTCGVLMEPQPRVYEELANNYGRRSARFKLVNSALIAPDSTETTGIIYAPQKGPNKNGCTFLNTGVATMLTHKRDSYSKRSRKRVKRGAANCEVEWEEVNISTTTVEQLNLPSRYHLLQIDAEGLDAKIVRWSEIDKFRPALIRLEVNSISPEELTEIAAYLKVRGYSDSIREGPDAHYCREDNFV